MYNMYEYNSIIDNVRDNYIYLKYIFISFEWFIHVELINEFISKLLHKEYERKYLLKFNAS